MFSDFFCRLRAAFRRKVVEQELDDELRFHLEQQTEKHIRAGISRDEAVRLARLALQGPEQVKELCRDAQGTLLWDNTLQDIRYAARQLKGAPAFAIVAVTILALGIGANTAIFSLLNTVMLRTLPVRDSRELIVPRWTAKTTPHPYHEDDYDSCFTSRVPGAAGSCTFPYPLFRLMESEPKIFSSVAAFAGPVPLSVSGHGPAAVVDGEIVSDSFFQTLGVQAAIGKTFNAGEDRPTANRTVVLSYAFWKGSFAGDVSVLGKVIGLNSNPFTIIGVAQPGFDRLTSGRICQLWIPIHSSGNLGISWLSLPLNSEHHFWLRIVARKKPGVSAARAESVLTALFRNQMVFQSKVLQPSDDASIEITPANKALGLAVREMFSKPIAVLMCAVSLILLIACTNLAGLTFARAAARQRELAIRLAVGAWRGRIVRQLLTESIVIATLGGIAGFAIAFGVTRLLTHFLEWAQLDVKPDGRVLLFTTIISFASGIVFGILPALRSTRTDRFSPDNRSMSLPQTMSPADRRRRVSNLLVVAQVALAVVMLVGAGLLVRTLVNLKNINPGFNPRHILLFGLDPTSLHYEEPRIQNLYRTLRDRIAALPGVTSITYSQNAPLTDSRDTTKYQIEGRQDQGGVRINILPVGPDFFRAMGIPLLQGRDFTARDFTGAQKVVIVNQAFVKKYLPGRSVLGLHLGGDSHTALRMEIVGLVRDARQINLRDEIPPMAYLPLLSDAAHFEVRLAGNPSTLISSVRKIVSQADPNLPLFDIESETKQIDTLLLTERLVALLSTAFGLLALTLASVGLYGLLSYEVTRRRREIGIRMAIGADPNVIQASILRETLIIVVVGLACGIPVALASVRGLSAMLYGVQSSDPATILATTAILILVAGFAGYLPARRASLVDPAVALRAE